MLEFLARKKKQRKLTLFTFACCRRVWHLVHDNSNEQELR
jgi:hypothetical protein